MRKNRLTTVAAFTTFTALAALTTPCAFAQSSVTLYGVLDEGIDYTDNAGGSPVWEMASGYAQGSRWGLKGSEDLGAARRRCSSSKTASTSARAGSARAAACSAVRRSWVCPLTATAR